MRAEAIAKALGGRRCGSGWAARCPAHDDRTPSLSIRDAEWQGAGALPCRLRPGARHRCAAIARLVGHRHSAAVPGSRCRTRRAGSATTPSARSRARHLAVREPAEGTLVESLSRLARARPRDTDHASLPSGLKHPSGGFWPAMVALVTHGVDDTPLAIHRTFLARDGAGKAPVDRRR